MTQAAACVSNFSMEAFMPASFMQITQRFTQNGAPLVGYSVVVTYTGGNTKARLYNDANGSARFADNILITDADGNISAYVDGSKTYRLSVRNQGSLPGFIAVVDPVFPLAAGVVAQAASLQADSNDVPFAAAITPVCSKPETVLNIGALTGAMTVNAPTNPQKGFRLQFMFAQDATGGRAITWNAVFSKAADGAGTPSQVGATEFVYNGSKWLQVGGALTFR